VPIKPPANNGLLQDEERERLRAELVAMSENNSAVRAFFSPSEPAAAAALVKIALDHETTMEVAAEAMNAFYRVIHTAKINPLLDRLDADQRAQLQRLGLARNGN